MAVAGLVVAIIGLFASVGSGVYSALVAKYGSEARGRGMNLLVQIAKKISSNNALLQRFQALYNEKNQAGLNELYKGMGFGPRAMALLSSIRENETWYRSKLKEVSDQNKDLEAMQNEANAAVSNAGTSITGNKMANESIDAINDKVSKVQDLEQNINGGAQNGI